MIHDAFLMVHLNTKEVVSSFRMVVFGDTDTWDSPRLRFFDCSFTALKPRFQLDVNAMSSWSDLPPQAEAKCRSFLDVKSLTRFEMSAWSQHTSSLNRKLACIL